MKIEEISDEQMKKAVANVRTSLLKKLPDPQDCQHDFSPEFEQKMELLRKQNKQKLQRKTRIRNIAAILILILVGVVGWLLTNQEAVASFKRWVVREKNVQPAVHYYVSSPESELPDYTFGWLPDGFEISEKRVFPNAKMIIAKNAKNKTIILEYQYMSEATEKEFFGESITQENIQVGEQDGVLFSDAREDSASILFWSSEEIAYTINSQLEKEIMMKIAENVKRE